MASVETEWTTLLSGAYETLDLFTKGKGIGNIASDFLNEMYHPQEILHDSEKRNTIIGIMPRDYAEYLGNRLKINWKNVDELYTSLKKINYNSTSERIFLEFFGIEPLKKYKEEEVIGVERLSKDLLGYPLRSYQHQILSDLKQIFEKGSRRCMIHMPTGSGKTRTAMYYISELLNSDKEQMVLWLAYSKELCDQASEEFKKIWTIRGSKEASIFRFYGKSDCVLPSKKTNGIIITTLSKILAAKKKDSTALSILSNKIDLVLFDEAHQIVAPRYESIVNDVVQLNDKSKLIGLTATPGRTWDDPLEDEKLSSFFYHNIVSLKTDSNESPNAMLTRTGYLSKIEWIHCECECPVLTSNELNLIKKLRDDGDIPPSVLNKLSTDAKRNAKILSEIELLLQKQHKRILLFATSVEHARIMTGILKIFVNKYDCSVDCIDSSTNKGLREIIIKNFKSDDTRPHILCNYGVLTTGFDAPNVDAGVIARPTKSLVLFSQMVGRMIRGPKTKGGTERATIVSVVDVNLPGFKDAYNNWTDVWK